ncbi:hypothetical protein GCM10009304_28430 [Pseudomonas matsuisoli]|uniref:Uncharacterized protein n=1 Tax=Pseudomonas matsuisoli TaxID=1515666 RepID=A0A917UZH5_9PSED|nr:hypothetical protein GCM10009304_28430 [Pseudomonas matsuisoli]
MLAKAVSPAKTVLSAPPHSRASSLLQQCAIPEIGCTLIQLITRNLCIPLATEADHVNNRLQQIGAGISVRPI